MDLIDWRQYTCSIGASVDDPILKLFALFGLLWLANAAGAAPPSAVRVEVRPALATLTPGQRQHFEAVGYDATGAEIPFAADWSTEAGAHIDASGLFIADRAGRYTVVAGDGQGRALGTAVAIVQQPHAALGELLVRPREARLGPGDKVQFQALLLDRDGNARDAQLLWQASGGRIDQKGVFTAGANPGSYRITVLDRRSRLQASAVVVIVTGH